MVRAFAFSARIFLLFCLTTGTLVPAAEKGGEAVEVLGLFDGLKAGDIEAQLIAKDSTAGTVILANKTKRPLAIQMPAAFAGVPVAAQFGAGFFNNNGNNFGNNNRNNTAPQNIGGAVANAAGPGFPAAGIFNVGPERAVKIKFVAVCLQHGKPEPNTRLAYEIRPIETVTSEGTVAELVAMLGQGEIDQPAAQAAAWHLTDGLSWQELGKKIGLKHLSGVSEPYFTASQIERAKKGVETAERRAKTAKDSVLWLCGFSHEVAVPPGITLRPPLRLAPLRLQTK